MGTARGRQEPPDVSPGRPKGALFALSSRGGYKTILRATFTRNHISGLQQHNSRAYSVYSKIEVGAAESTARQ